MAVSETNKAQYNLDSQKTKISALSLGTVGKHKFLACKDVLLEKDLLEKAATIKRFENSPLGGELEKHTDIAKRKIKIS